MAMQPPPLLSGHEHRPTFDGSSPPPPQPPYSRVPGDAPFFEPYNDFASNFYGGVGRGGYFSPLNRAPMLPSLLPQPPPYVYDLGRRLPPPVPFAPHFGLPVPSPMFEHHHRISPFDANFGAPFYPLDPFDAPFNPRSMSTPTIAAAAVDPAQEMAMQQPLLSGHARRPRFDGRSPPPPYWRAPHAAPFDPYNGFASNYYGGGGGGGGYFSQLNRAPMLPSPPPPPPPYAYALGCRIPPPAPFTPHFGLPAPSPMFDHRHRIPPFGANFAAPFPPLDPSGAPFNPEASGSVIDFNDRNEINDHSELLRKLCNQVEYYFSDENLVSDWYLKSRMDSEGWVSLKEIASFHKVRHLTKNLLDVFQVLREALSTSVCVEIQDDKVRKSVVVRNPPSEAIPAPGP